LPFPAELNLKASRFILRASAVAGVAEDHID